MYNDKSSYYVELYNREEAFGPNLSSSSGPERWQENESSFVLVVPHTTPLKLKHVRRHKVSHGRRRVFPINCSTMTDPLSRFMHGLITGSALDGDQIVVNVVVDNCVSISERERGQYRIAYRSPVAQGYSSRWDPTYTRLESPTKWKDSNDEAIDAKLFPILPFRRPSLGAGDETWKPSTSKRNQPTDKTPNLPPRNPAARSSLRWSLALDESDSAPKISIRRSISYGDDEDTDSESESNASEFSDSADEPEDDEVDWSAYDDCNSRWTAQNVAPIEWTLPNNAILPNIQKLIWEAAHSKDVDINECIRASLSKKSIPAC
jgi:hypothetical protein